jgi:hypothetical protein
VNELLDKDAFYGRGLCTRMRLAEGADVAESDRRATYSEGRGRLGCDPGREREDRRQRQQCVAHGGECLQMRKRKREQTSA